MMLTARVRKARYGDIDIVAANMRQADKDEVWSSNHLAPREALEKSYKNSSICMTIEFRGKPVGMFGVVPFTLIGNQGSVWLLGTDSICNVNRKLLRYSKRFIGIMLSYYPHLENYVSVNNKASIKWLKFCNCIMEEAKPYGAENQLFHRFIFERGIWS